MIAARFEDMTPAERLDVARSATACFLCHCTDAPRNIWKEHGKIVVLCEVCRPNLNCDEIAQLSETIQ